MEAIGKGDSGYQRGKERIAGLEERGECRAHVCTKKIIESRKGYVYIVLVI